MYHKDMISCTSFRIS